MSCFCSSSEPVPLTDEQARSQVEDLRNRLSQLIPPLEMDGEQWRSQATVNLSSLPSGALLHQAPAALGVFERRVSQRWQDPQQQQHGQNGQQQHGGGGSGGLQWTESRKLLEAAIGIEQMQSIPEGGAGASLAAEVAAGGGRDGGEALLTASEESRLNHRLQRLHLHHQIQLGDGNCQFRSISFGLYGTPRHHAHVRRCAVAHMQRQRREFEAFLGEEFGLYVRDVARSGAWGDELTLRAASEALAVVVNVISSGASNWFLRYTPRSVPPRHEIFLTYISPVHYNAVRRLNTGDRLRNSFGGGQANQLARAVSSYQRRFGIPDTPHEAVAASLGGDT